jgi:ferrous iron transport protein B
VGNYPGVTVEKKTGPLEHAGRRFILVDLPGLYSLAPQSRDEIVSVEVLLGGLDGVAPVDAVVCIVDASNLERNLYLVSQVLDLGLPTVVALNMLDVAKEHGVEIDVGRLRERLGVPVVATQANRGVGLAELRDALVGLAAQPGATTATPFPAAFEEEVARLQLALNQDGLPSPPLPRWMVRRLLLDVKGHLQRSVLPEADGRVPRLLHDSREKLAKAGCRIPGVETDARYDWARKVMAGAVVRPRRYGLTGTDRVDRVLTHRVWGTLVFAVVMAAVFQSVFVGAEPLMKGIDGAIKAIGGWISARMAEGALASLLVDGVLGGVGGILTFLPQILILFLFLAVLEDCGYMARAAYLMDRLMVRVGLSGKSFIPLLSSFACAVPGIMATRVIENERDRLTTILVAPLMTCSARLPIYALLITAFIPGQKYLGGLLSLQGLTLVGLYLLGIVIAVAAAKVFKRTILRGETPPFLMELPSYKWPSLKTVAFRVGERAFLFVRFAGTLILAVSIIVWAALYYPHGAEVEAPFRAQRDRIEAQLSALDEEDPARSEVAAELAIVEREIAAAYQGQSYLGRFGRLIEPVFRPMGWDWRIGTAVIASFPAREIVVATFGVIFNLGDEVSLEHDDDAIQLKAKLQAATWDGTGAPLFTLPVALSIMVFYALCAQCAATLAVIRRETNSWRWPLFTFGYMTTLAYVGAMATYQVGTWLSG